MPFLKLFFYVFVDIINSVAKLLLKKERWIEIDIK